MTYFPHSEKEINTMLSDIGLTNLEDLIKPIPKKFIYNKLNLEKSKTEIETSEYFRELADKNKGYDSIFLGGGAYNHYIPASIDEITGRQEFYTSYTPYQAEISQGTLQAIFEYQTYIAKLTGLDISNASMYDGATALAESVIMSVKTTGQNKVLVDEFIHPEYIEVLRTYLKPLNIQIDIYKGNTFSFNINDFKTKWNSCYACFAISNPNFLGSILDLSGISEIIHNDKRNFILTIQEALSLVLLKSPFEFGADITCGEAQSFGIPLSYGGPYLGFISCKKEFLRKMPGRIVGQTIDRDGKVAYQLTLSAREQHIRRDAATSNICSNHSLQALRASIYLSVLGNRGLKECALKNVENSHYLKNKIKNIKKLEVIKEQIFFNEFVVRTEIDNNKIKNSLEKENILSFLNLERFYPSLKNFYLVCATELNTFNQIDRFCEILGSL